MALDFRGVHLEVLEDDTPQIDLEGARMSGKSWLICAKVVLSCLAHPGILWLICRYSNETTRTMLRPIFQRVAQMYGVPITWDDDESAFHFPSVDGKISKVYAYGLKSQTITEAKSKVRGLDVAGIWNDQAEETPQAIADELPFGTRQPGYPHQVIFSPNPPTEDHFLTDMFPEDNPFSTRRYYRVSLYDNAHNLPPDKIRELEEKFPPTHAAYKSLVLGQRGPNVTGKAVYESMFAVNTHAAKAIAIDPNSRVFEAVDMGKHHPVWMVAQRTPMGGLNVLGGVMGKRMFIEDFLPVMDYYRQEWFHERPRSGFRLCCDAPEHMMLLREAELDPIYHLNANAPDTRETVIQRIASFMRRNSFQVNADKAKWVSVSSVVTKHTNLFIDGLEASYVWDEHLVSVGNKKVRQPKLDQWVDGWQRCLENIVLNFCQTGQDPPREPVHVPQTYTGPMSWLGS